MSFRSFVDKMKDMFQKQDSLNEVPSPDDGDLSPPPLLVPPPLKSESIPRRASDSPSGGKGIAGLSNRNDAPARGRPAIVQSDGEDSFYNERAEQVQRIQEIFGEFGPTVSSYVLTQSLTSGGVGRIVIKLGLTTRGRDGADLAQVENWLLKNGVEKFCKTVGLRLPGAASSSSSTSAVKPPSDQIVVRRIDPTITRENEEGPVVSVPVASRTVNRASTINPNTPQPVRSHLQKVTVTPVRLDGSPDPEQQEVAPATEIAPATPPTTDPSAPASKGGGFPFSPPKK